MAFLDQDHDALSPQRKGVLFESLTRRLATQAGYSSLILRVKHSSLEYDVEGQSSLHGVRLVGEAKAHEANVSGQVVSAFVGKLMPLAGEDPLHGLFISTSVLTAEARDYLDGTIPALRRYQVELRTLVGAEIAQFFAEHAGYVGDDTLKSRLRELYGLELLDTWLVCTSTGEFLVASCGPDNIAAATSFAAFKTDGTELGLDETQTRRLRSQLPDLASLVPVSGESGVSADTSRVERLPTVAAGAGSFDYRFPAPPEHFIGRQGPLSELEDVIEQVRAGKTALRSLQVLSRSGVGKSSLLLKAPTSIGVPFVTIDGRSIRTAADARLVVTEAVIRGNEQLGASERVAEPRSLEEAALVLERLGHAIAVQQGVLVIQIDQFESTLRLPSVFEAVLNLVRTTTSQRLPIVWVFARKNDLTSTFDESAQVDLGRLNEISRQTRLDDFGPGESRLMFDQLAHELGEAVRPDLANAISTFSAGFPWLHKRLCAHVLAMKSDGVTQRELVQAGLRAEDLFEEDLAGLMEEDRALLRRLASHLPATAGELASHLEAEITVGRLTQKLNDFLGTKLLRLSGDIYDAYNDVFKTYLVTDTIPFEARYVYRAPPLAAIDMLRRIAEMGPQSLAEFQARIGGGAGANLNKLRELRLLGLIKPQAGHVELSLETQEALDNDGLGELLRRRLRGNGLVVRALDLIAANELVTLEELVGELRGEMPQVQGVSDTTWRQYARTLASWLHFASLAQLEGDNLSARDLPADEALQGRAFTRGAFAPNTFIPSVRPDKLVELLGLFDRAEDVSRSEVEVTFGKTRAPGAVQDAVALDLVRDDGDHISLGPHGSMLIAAGRAISARDIAQLALSKPNIKALLEAATPGPLAPESQRTLVARFGSAQWTDATWKWRLGILRSWVVATGLATSSRAGLSARSGGAAGAATADQRTDNSRAPSHPRLPPAQTTLALEPSGHAE